MINIKQIYNLICENLICEGGASGHMKHLFEDPNLTFGQLKEILTKLFNGKISVFEKTDGQALAVTYKDGKVGAARNKATLKDPMTLLQVEAKFDGRGELKDAFVKSMTDISKAIETLTDEEKKEIFNDGKNFMAFEIIYPPTKNVVDYGNRCLIQLHGVNIYNDKYEKISEDKVLAKKLYTLLKLHDALNQKTFQITSDAKLKLKNSKSGLESLLIILNKLAKVENRFTDESTINDYALSRFLLYIYNMAKESELKLSKDSNFVKKLSERMCNISKEKVNKRDLIAYAKTEDIDVKDQKFKDFVAKIELTADEANLLVIKPLEDLVIEAGLLLMQNFVGYVSSDPKKSALILATELNSTIQELSSEETSLDPSKLARFKKNLAKLDQYQKELTGVEGIVFLYKGKVYKMTATFGAVNQLLGILKYG